MATKTDNLVRKTIYGQWLADKRYIDLLSVRGTPTPLSFAERLVFSFIIWLDRMKPGEAKSLSVIAKRLHLGRNNVAEAANNLEKRGLITKSSGRANAILLLPTGEKIEDFFVMKSGRPSSNRIYLLTDEAEITMRDNVLLSVLYSLAAARQSIFIANRKNGLAKLASISRSQVDVSLARLKKVSAVALGSYALALKQPSPAFLLNFLDTGKKIAVGQYDKMFSIKPSSSDADPFADDINGLIAKYQAEQLAVGWSFDNCKSYWRTTLFDSGLDLNDWKEFLVFRYPALWITAQEQHAETGLAKTCRHLLDAMTKQTIEDMIRERRSL
jgi:hypothetical protein